MDRIKSIIRNVISPMQDGSVLIAYADYPVNKGMMDLYQVFHCESIDLEWSQRPMDSRLWTSAWHC
jgi:hypothetical protein